MFSIKTSAALEHGSRRSKLPEGQNDLVQHLEMTVVPWRIRDPLRRAYGSVVFRIAIRRFLRAVSAGVHPSDALISDLIYGWSNEYWSALDEYLLACIDHALAARGPILECGSGLSTLVVGAIAQQRGLQLWTLEHDTEWAARLQRHLDRYHIHSVVVCTKPLRDYGDFSWYDAPTEAMPSDFALVVCDGPPSGNTGGRYGLAAIMKANLRRRCVILLDDADRDEEREIARRWEGELDATSKRFGRAKPFIEMTLS